MNNPMMLMQIKVLFDQFKKNHAKFPMFLKAASKQITTNSIIEICVTLPDGKKLNTNMKVSKDDVDLFRQLKKISEER